MTLIEFIVVATPIISTVVAMIGLGVAVWVAFTQRRIQKRQIQQNLFDKRFAVYNAVRELLMTIVRADGRFDWKECVQYLYTVESAEFLFGDDVNKHLLKVREKAKSIYEIT